MKLWLRALWQVLLRDYLSVGVMLELAIWYGARDAVQLVAAGFLAFLAALDALGRIERAVREIPRQSVNVFDCRTQTRVDGDEWKQ